MKVEIKHRGSEVIGMPKWDFYVLAETVEDVQKLSKLYEYEKEGLNLRLFNDHTGFSVEAGMWK